MCIRAPPSHIGDIPDTEARSRCWTALSRVKFLRTGDHASSKNSVQDHNTYGTRCRRELTCIDNSSSRRQSRLINKNRDYVTLINCTPYGINSHRLLVRGERIPYREAKKKDKSECKTNIMWKAYALLGVLAVVLIILLWYYYRIRPKKKKARKKQVRRNEK